MFAPLLALLPIVDNFAKSREISKSIMDKGQSAADDLNSYAWNALLLPDPISQETLDVAQRANDLAKNSFATQVSATILCRVRWKEVLAA